MHDPAGSSSAVGGGGVSLIVAESQPQLKVLEPIGVSDQRLNKSVARRAAETLP